MFFFLPLGTTRPRWRVPRWTYALIGANLAVFLLQVGSLEAMPEGFVPNRPSPVGWIASIFMHAGLLHLAGNMLFLWLFCTLTEDVFGPWLMLGFYFAGNAGATLLHVITGTLFAPQSLSIPVVGASGAIAGIMGLSAACFLQTKVRVWYLIGMYFYWRTNVIEIAAPVFLALWGGWEVVQGVVSTSMQATYGGAGGVAHWAHVGGFAVGLAGALALNLRERVVYTDLVDGKRPMTNHFEAFRQAGELEQMVTRSPNNADAWYALGRAREVSGRPERSGEAYARALALFLKERRETDAVEAYAAMKEYRELPALPEAVLFLLGCALEEAGRKNDAFEVLRRVSVAGVQGPQRETALIRAAEIARALPGYRVEAEQCYQTLLREFPYSPWRGMATEGLAKLRAVPAEEPPIAQEKPSFAGQRAPEKRPATRFDRLERLGQGERDKPCRERVE